MNMQQARDTFTRESAGDFWQWWGRNYPGENSKSLEIWMRKQSRFTFRHFLSWLVREDPTVAKRYALWRMSE